MRALVMVLLLACAQPALATNVLVMGDSEVAGQLPSGWPTQLQHLRPTYTVTNGGLSGDTSADCDRRLRDYLAAGSYTYIIVWIGVNDYATVTPTRTALTIRRMVQEIRAAGALPVILTLPPVHAAIDGSNAAYALQDAHAAAVSALLVAGFVSGGGAITIGDLRNFVGDAGWTVYSRDGLHPLPGTGEVPVARFVASLLP